MDEDAKCIARKAAEVMLAFADGKKIQAKSRTSEWYDLHGDPTWDWNGFNYRVKPEPREWWVNEYRDGPADFIYPSKEKADSECASNRIRRFRVREVLED